MKGRGMLRAACWEASVNSNDLTNLNGPSVKAVCLFSLAAKESQQWWDLPPWELTHLEGSCGEIGPWQITNGYYLDAIQHWMGKANKVIDEMKGSGWSAQDLALVGCVMGRENKPGLDTMYSQACTVFWYLDRYADEDETDESVMAAIHHGGPDEESTDMVEYIEVFEGLFETVGPTVFCP